MVKTHALNLCKLLTRSTVIITHSSELRKPPSRFVVAENAIFKALQAYYTLCGGQNTLSKALTASYTLCGG